jgi:hypothetical protein
MSSDQKFVCRIADDPRVQEAYDALTAWQKQRDEQAKFLEQQAKALKDANIAHWKRLWDAAQEAGFIDKNLSYNDYNMNLGDERRQLFINKDKGDGSGLSLGDLIGGIILGKPPKF